MSISASFHPSHLQSWAVSLFCVVVKYFYTLDESTEQKLNSPAADHRLCSVTQAIIMLLEVERHCRGSSFRFSDLYLGDTPEKTHGSVALCLAVIYQCTTSFLGMDGHDRADNSSPDSLESSQTSWAVNLRSHKKVPWWNQSWKVGGGRITSGLTERLAVSSGLILSVFCQCRLTACQLHCVRARIGPSVAVEYQ